MSDLLGLQPTRIQIYIQNCTFYESYLVIASKKKKNSEVLYQFIVHLIKRYYQMCTFSLCVLIYG